MLGQHWQMAQAAEPKQLKREILNHEEYFWPTSCNIQLIQQFMVGLPCCSATQGDDGPHCGALGLSFSSSLKISWFFGRFQSKVLNSGPLGNCTGPLKDA